MTPNDSVAFTTESEELDVQATDRVKMTRTGKPVICHICGNNHYANRCPDREDGTPGKKSDKAKDNSRKESPQLRHQFIWRLGEIGGMTPTTGA